MSHFHLPRFHLPHLHLPPGFSWRSLTQQGSQGVSFSQSRSQASPSSASAVRGLALLLAVLGILLGAVALSTHLKADVAQGAAALQLSAAPSTQGDYDPFALAKQEAIAEELPPQF